MTWEGPFFLCPLDILIQILHDENQDYGMLFIVDIVL